MSLTKTTYSMIAGASLNVLDYGCVGDGVNDDTSAFQSALNAAQSQGKAMYVPGGTYKITSTLTSVNPVKVFGEWGVKDSGASIIRYSGTGDCWVLGDTSSTGFSVPNHKYGFDISNLQIVGSPGGESGLVIWNASGYYSNLYVRNFDDYSITLQQGWASSFQNVITHYSTKGGLYVNNPGGAISIISCAFLSHEKGLLFNNTAPFSGGIYSAEVLESDFEGCTYGVYFGHAIEATYDEVTSIRFDTIHFESNTNNFYQASGCFMWGCQFNNASFSSGTSTFKSRMYNCSMDTPTFFSTSAMECTGAVKGLIVSNPSFYTGYSGAGIVGAAVIGTTLGTSGNIPSRSLIVQSGTFPGVWLGNTNANFPYTYLEAKQTSGGVVAFADTSSSVYNVQVNEAVSSVTINFTDSGAQNGAIFVLYIQTSSVGSLSKTVTLNSTGEAFKPSSNVQTPSATTKINVYTFARTITGWIETARTIDLNV